MNILPNYYTKATKILCAVAAAALLVASLGFGFFHARSTKASFGNQRAEALQQAPLKGSSINFEKGLDSDPTSLDSPVPIAPSAATEQVALPTPQTTIFQEKLKNVSWIYPLQTQGNVFLLVESLIDQLQDAVKWARSSDLPAEVVETQMLQYSQKICDELFDFDQQIQEILSAEPELQMTAEENKHFKQSAKQYLSAFCADILLKNDLGSTEIQIQPVQQSESQAHVDLIFNLPSSQSDVTISLYWTKEKNNMWRIEEVYFGSIALLEQAKKEIMDIFEESGKVGLFKFLDEVRNEK